MKIGVCCAIPELDGLSSQGIRAVELSASTIAGLNEAELHALKRTLETHGIKLISVNGLIGGVPPLSEAKNFAKMSAYFTHLFERLNFLQVDRAVFGSGKFRGIPDGADRGVFEVKFEAFLRMLCDISARYGVKLLLEHLNRSECNFIVTAKEAYEWIGRIGHPNLGLLLDLYHFSMENENLDDIPGYGAQIGHVHLAAPETRRLPSPAEKDWYERAFAALKAAGYYGFVSLETRRDGTAGVAESCAFLESLL